MDSKPKLITVVIPCRNEKRHIRDTVESVLKSRNVNLEVIVVDGMSTDGTRQVLEELQNENPDNFKYIDNPEQLTPFAFNHGVRASQGEYVQISGARNILAPDYLQKLVKILDEKPDVSSVGGNYEHAYDSEQGRFISYAMESKFGMGPDNFRTLKEDSYVDTVGIPLFRKTVFDEIGFFDERLTRNQDDDFSYRLIEAGHKIYYCASARTSYFVRDSFSKLSNQFQQYGYFKVFVNKKHKTFTTLRQVVPACFLLFLVLGPVTFIFSNFLLFLYLLTLAVYYVLGLLSSAQFTTSLKEMSSIQYATLIMHLSYGYGYLKGVVDFVILNKNPSNNMQTQTT